MKAKPGTLRDRHNPRRSCQRNGELVRLLVAGEQTQGRFALVETIVRCTEEPPLHSHTHEDEIVYVLQGEVTFYLEGARLERGAGECIFLPRGSEHTYCIESGEARMLVLLTPAGLEGYYQEMNRPIDAEQYIERMITAAAKYGLEIMGPGPLESPASDHDSTYQSGGAAPENQQ